jgi:hypothetical protein
MPRLNQLISAADDVKLSICQPLNEAIAAYWQSDEYDKSKERDLADDLSDVLVRPAVHISSIQRASSDTTEEEVGLLSYQLLQHALKINEYIQYVLEKDNPFKEYLMQALGSDSDYEPLDKMHKAFISLADLITKDDWDSEWENSFSKEAFHIQDDRTLGFK